MTDGIRRFYFLLCPDRESTVFYLFSVQITIMNRIFVGKVLLNFIFKFSFAIEQILLFRDEILCIRLLRMGKFRSFAMTYVFVNRDRTNFALS